MFDVNGTKFDLTPILSCTNLTTPRVKPSFSLNFLSRSTSFSQILPTTNRSTDLYHYSGHRNSHHLSFSRNQIIHCYVTMVSSSINQDGLLELRARARTLQSAIEESAFARRDRKKELGKRIAEDNRVIVEDVLKRACTPPKPASLIEQPKSGLAKSFLHKATHAFRYAVNLRIIQQARRLTDDEECSLDIYLENFASMMECSLGTLKQPFYPPNGETQDSPIVVEEDSEGAD
jgi:hypothetical protein